jgi:hypothetical protein
MKGLFILMIIFVSISVSGQKDTVTVWEGQKCYFDDYEVVYGSNTFTYNEIEVFKVIKVGTSENILWLRSNTKDFFITHSDMKCVEEGEERFTCTIYFKNKEVKGSLFINFNGWYPISVTQLVRCFQPMKDTDCNNKKSEATLLKG